MSAPPQGDALSPVLRERVLERLKLSAPVPTTLDGLAAVYGAWCERVPFDNLRKLIALRNANPAPFPGGTADDFFAAWLADGTGGTCWPSSNALYTLLRSLGFDVRRITGSMRDLGLVNHGTVVVFLGGKRWLVDTSWLHQSPVPLEPAIVIQRDPVFGIEAEPADDGQHLMWAVFPPLTYHLPCRLYSDEVSHAFYLDRYEASRERSPFNQRLYARRNHRGEILVLSGHTRFRKTRAGIISEDLSAEQLLASLRDEFGYSGQLLDRWRESGALAASFEPPSGPKPPPVTGLPPSLRRT